MTIDQHHYRYKRRILNDAFQKRFNISDSGSLFVHNIENAQIWYEYKEVTYSCYLIKMFFGNKIENFQKLILRAIEFFEKSSIFFLYFYFFRISLWNLFFMFISLILVLFLFYDHWKLFEICSLKSF